MATVLLDKEFKEAIQGIPQEVKGVGQWHLSSSAHSSLSILVRRAIMQSAAASCREGEERGEERADTARPITGEAWIVVAI